MDVHSKSYIYNVLIDLSSNGYICDHVKIVNGKDAVTVRNIPFNLKR